MKSHDVFSDGECGCPGYESLRRDQAVEDARRPLLESIKDLETQIKVLRKEKHQACMNFAAVSGVIRGLLVPPMEEAHVDLLIQRLCDEDQQRVVNAVSVIVANLRRALG